VSVHSIDRDTWTTKLERIGTAAALKPDMVFNNLGHCITVGMLRELYYRADGSKAIGIDNVTKEKYGENLECNLRNLIERVRKGHYRPKPSRITEIPKEDGSYRPLAISCFEDKLIQNAVSIVLNKIFEPIFLPCSYGARPGRNCHDALRALNQYNWRLWDGAIVEIDIRKYFNTIPHRALNECLQRRISDKRFLKLINTLMKAPTWDGNRGVINKIGCPQGSIISPILANIYLHYVIDAWFEEIKKAHMRADANQVRYLDDMVFVFRFRSEAEKFFKVLPKRLAKYGLEMHLDKSQLISAGNKTALQAHRNGKRLQTYKFLGFVCYWSRAGNGSWRLKYKSRPDRFRAKLKGLRNYLWDNLNIPNTDLVLDQVIRVVRGWINYHGISDNKRCVQSFILQCSRLLFKWVNRRGRKHPMNWEVFSKILKEKGFPSTWKTISIYSNEPNKG
jgi:group II intron reverse transcriptase/maturase